MPSWEDWDYWLRMAQAEHCFTHIPEETTVYSFFTGNRRELGQEIAHDLLLYLQQKYQRSSKAMCNCKSKTVISSAPPAERIAAGNMAMRSEGDIPMSDNSIVLVRLVDNNRAMHQIHGAVVFEHQPSGVSSVRTGGGYKIAYGYHADGDMFYIHVEDFKHMLQIFQLVQNAPPPQPQPEPAKVAEVPAPTPVAVSGDAPEPIAPPKRGRKPKPPAVDEKEIPVIVKKRFDLQTIPGVGPAFAQKMTERGMTTPEMIKLAGVEGLLSIHGMTNERADLILQYLKAFDEDVPVG
jgi:predicted flap endonuclease-1-like 5' DNA nuclease